MRRFRQPDLWFLVALLAVVVVGAALLAQSGAVHAESRRLSYFRHYWQAGFDATSAACGVGLLTYGFEDDYTARGRWILTALGVTGAVLFLAAVTDAVRRIRTGDAQVRTPHPLLAAGVLVVVQAVTLGVVLAARQIGGGEASPSEGAWDAIAAFSSLGWTSGTRHGLEAWPLALLAWLGALGWPIWLLLVPPLSRRYVRWRAALAMFGAHAVVLLLSALLISAFEAPRGTIGRGAPSDTLSGQIWKTRYARSLVQTVAAAGAGIPTEALGEGNVTAGSKVTLSAVLLVGGLGGSATGGIQWPLLLWALAGGAAALGRLGRSEPAPDLARWMHAGLAGVFLLGLLALLAALGLLLIEGWTASRFQPAPTFADALLDACSVVAGGNLSGGLTEAVTSRNLVSGIRQSANLYQFGMIWLMLAMLAGRMLPLVILRRLATVQR